jgi:hypothetical protein
MDFSTLVLGPCQGVFGKPITINPIASIPGARPYAATGIWNVRHVDIVLEGGRILTSRTIKVDVQLAVLPASPMQSDQITFIADDQFLPFGIRPGQSVTLIVDDTHEDSGGASGLVCKVFKKGP